MSRTWEIPHLLPVTGPHHLNTTDAWVVLGLLVLAASLALACFWTAILSGRFDDLPPPQPGTKVTVNEPDEIEF